MNRLMRLFVVAAVAVVLVSPLSADDDAKKKKKGAKGKGRNAVAAQLMKRLEKAELTEEQQQKIKEIVAEHREKLAAAQKEVAALVTPDARKKAAAATKSARESGKKGKELQAATLAALGLSAEDAAKYKTAQAKVAEIRGSLTKAAFAVLTEEQRKKAGIKVRQAQPKKKKKKDAA